jgi:NAD(P)-dependent dehydrogenase (short-subunit alcohol dehydrogenase family)
MKSRPFTKSSQEDEIMQLKDKVVIITGASKGLGVSMAEICAAEGAKVVLAARTLDQLKVVENRIRAKGGVAHSVRTDMSVMRDLQNLVDETLKKFGAVHGLINNAGVNYVKAFLDTTEADWDRVIDTDLKGSFFLAQLCAREMVKQTPKGGSIINIASVHTLASLAGSAPYDAAKHGMVGFTKSVAVELGKDNVRVNVLSPGLCRTEIWNDLVAAAPSEEACLSYWNDNIPAQRLIEPEEIANACVFLLSDLSSSFTGANLLADLGMTSQLISREPFTSKTIDGTR